MDGAILRVVWVLVVMHETGVGASLDEPSSVEKLEEGSLEARLYDWFAQHLAQLMGPALLGIVCTRLGVVFADVAPPHLPLAERVQRLLAYLVQTHKRIPENPHSIDGLCALCQALLTDEATAAGVIEHGLPELLGLSTDFAAVHESGAALDQSYALVLELSMATARTDARPSLPWACICQPLPAPPAWLGRDAELGALDAHLRTGAKVVFLRGVSGAGKSTLIGRWLRELTVASAVWQEAGFDGVLYWSFAHDPDVHAFFRTAADYVWGLKPGAVNEPSFSRGSDEDSACRYHLDRLLAGLSRRPGPTLLVLDGLERLPTHPQLVSLLLALVLGTARGAVVATLHAPMAGLLPWLGTRYIEIEVPPLSPSEGAELLRYSGVIEGDAIDVQQRSVEHDGHALTLHLLGRYLHAYFQGDGRAVSRGELPTSDTGISSGDPRDLITRTSLRQVLRAHLLALSEPARRLLDLCVLLPGLVRISALQALLKQVQQGDGIGPQYPIPAAWAAPAAASFRAPTPPAVLLPDSTWLQGVAGLVERLAELELLGLLHLVPLSDGEEAIEIHPLVREPIYREWLAGRGGFWTTPGQDLADVCGHIPRGEQALELLEQLVNLLLAAGQPDVAYAVLEHRLGGYLYHVHYLGRARRFLFLIRQLYPIVASSALSDMSWQRRYARLLTWEAETLRVLGQLEAALVTAQRQWPLGSTPLPRRLYQQARVLRSLGRLKQAATLATAARHGTVFSFDGVLASMELGLINLLSGDPSMCQVHLLDAAALLREDELHLTGFSKTPEALDLSAWMQRVWARRALLLGHLQRARTLLESCRASAEKRHSELDGAQCDVLLAELLRKERNYELAGQALHRALSAAGRSGDIETVIHGGLVQGCLRLETGHLDGAAAAFGPTLALASEHGFGIYRIDLLVWRGALSLRRGDFESAERDARDALAYATAPSCGYLWGEADALHLLATVLIATRPVSGSSRHTEAIAHLSDELELRERMSDPTAPDVRWLLRRIRP